MRAFIVTGTSRGLGFEICKQLIKRNHLVFSIARNKNDHLLELATQSGCEMHFIQYDLQHTEGVSDLMKGILERVKTNLESITLTMQLK